MSGLKGNVNDLKKLGQRLQKFPTSVAHQVATQSAPALTQMTRRAYESGQTVYGDARPTGSDGQALDLHKTGLTAATLRFTSVGTIVRCVLGTRYAKYLIGKYRILPMGRMPTDWSRKLGEIVSEQKF